MSDEKPKNLIFEDEKPLLLNHDYDGIEEFNHPLPQWWLMIFYATIVFAIIYGGYYLTVGPSLKEELNVSLKEIQAGSKANTPGAPNGTDDLKAIAAAIRDPEQLAAGEKVFVARCVVCHSKDGGGGIGPNLTDEFWLHGSHVTDMIKVVREGIPAKGMPPWGAILSPADAVHVVAYVYTLYGKPVANAKAPQGEKGDHDVF